MGVSPSSAGEGFALRCPSTPRHEPRRHRLHLLHDELDGAGLLVGRVVVLREQP